MDQPVYIISDLHLGCGDARDNFAHGDRERELLWLLRRVEVEKARLFILGDLFDFWQSNVFDVIDYRWSLLNRLWELMANTPHGCVYIPGNHDCDIRHCATREMIEHPFFQHCLHAPHTVEIGDKSVFMLHGHEADPWNAGDRPGAARALTIMSGLVEDAVGGPYLPGGAAVDAALSGMGEWLLKVWALLARLRTGKSIQVRALTPRQCGKQRRSLYQTYEAVYPERADIVIGGHTHRAGRYKGKRQGYWYFNSGSWAEGRNDVLRITPEPFRVEQFYCRGGALHYVEMEVLG